MELVILDKVNLLRDKIYGNWFLGSKCSKSYRLYPGKLALVQEFVVCSTPK
jgi:hypothetical protein